MLTVVTVVTVVWRCRDVVAGIDLRSDASVERNFGRSLAVTGSVACSTINHVWG